MPTSETGTSTSLARALGSGRGQQGFSLLELLVVVVIIGIFVGVAVLSVDITGRDREAEQEIARLRTIVDLVREEALMQSRDVGIMFADSSYRFFYYDYIQRAWLPPADDRLLQARSLPEPLLLELRVEDRPVVLEDDEDPELFDEPEPQVMILSTGEITPFSVDILREDREGRMTLTAEIDGAMEVITSEL